LVKPKVKKEAVVDDWEAAEIAEEEKEKVAVSGSTSEDESAAAVKIVPVVEGDTGMITKLEEEPITGSAEQSSEAVSPPEPSQVVSEPEADVTPNDVD
jgi:hypothetical protein